MNQNLYQTQSQSLLDDKVTSKRIELNLRRNKEQDNTEQLDLLSKDFKYEDCKNEMWNPESYSLLFGTPLWDQSSPTQKVLLNQLYWVAYYSQIISAEIATIFLNQTSAAGLYAIEDFRAVCDTLDLESAQERAHIAAFKHISESVEDALFGERLFTYPMKNFATETMIFTKGGQIRKFWKQIQLQAFSLLSSSNAFIACQYFTVRGLRTLNGKIVQHQLAQYYQNHPDQENAPIPSKVSHHHFLDESYHFNSSSIIGHDVIKSLKPPTAFEKHIANLGIAGTQRDHSHFNTTVNGIFWYEPAVFPTIYKLLRSHIFSMQHGEALDMLKKCFTHENQGIHLAAKTHVVARDSYVNYIKDIEYINNTNRSMKYMKKATIDRYLRQNRLALLKFEAGLAS